MVCARMMVGLIEVVELAGHGDVWPSSSAEPGVSLNMPHGTQPSRSLEKLEMLTVRYRRYEVH